MTISFSASAEVMDERLRNIAPVIQQIDNGQAIDPIKVDLKNYLYVLGIKTLRTKLKDHMVVVLTNGSTLVPVDGVLPTKVSLPFYELVRMYQQAYASNKKATIKFLKNNTMPLEIDIKDVIYKHTMMAPFSQASLKKLLKGLKLKSLAKDHKAVSLLQVYFAIGGVVNNPNNKKLYAYKKDKGYCFLLPPAESICIADGLLSSGIKKALSANVGLSIYKSKSEFDTSSTWRVAY
jgi:hypothetical protein